MKVEQGDSRRGTFADNRYLWLSSKAVQVSDVLVDDPDFAPEVVKLQGVRD